MNRIANALTRDLGVVPGNRVLLRAANNPMLVAAYLAVMKAGGIAVATMPLLRAKELAYPIEKARIAPRTLRCAARRRDGEGASALAPVLERIVYSADRRRRIAETLMPPRASPASAACDTASDDVCLIGFTSGTTGEPKGTHAFPSRRAGDLRRLWPPCAARPRRRSSSSARRRWPSPLASAGSCSFRCASAPHPSCSRRPRRTSSSPASRHSQRPSASPRRPPIAPCCAKLGQHDLPHLRKCVSAGETLPNADLRCLAGRHRHQAHRRHRRHRDAAYLHRAPTKTNPPRCDRHGRCRAIEARIVDEKGNELPRGHGRTACGARARPVAAISPTTARATMSATAGISPAIPISMDEDGYFWFQARSDDMIISAGYNIAGPEVEDALLTHPEVAECAVVGVPDEERGQIVKAFVVLRAGPRGRRRARQGAAGFREGTIAPYKYPRAIEFLDALPRTQTGKLQRFALRRLAAEASSHKLAS